MLQSRILKCSLHTLAFKDVGGGYVNLVCITYFACVCSGWHSAIPCLHGFSLSFPQSKDKPIRLTGTCDYLQQPAIAIFLGEAPAPSAYMCLKEDESIFFPTLPNSTLL